jgi:hypothetical protein
MAKLRHFPVFLRAFIIDKSTGILALKRRKGKEIRRKVKREKEKDSLYRLSGLDN